MPLPHLGIHGNHLDQYYNSMENSSDDETIADEANQSVEPQMDNRAADHNASEDEMIDANVVNDEPLIDAEDQNQCANEVDPLAHDERKPEYVPLYEVSAPNNSEIDEILLDEPQVIKYGDDVEILITETGVPQPFGATLENMVKRENDAISGNVPYNIKVSN